MPNWSEILQKDVILEVSYPGNIGFHELALFYRMASDEDEKEMERVLEDEDFIGFKKLISRVVGIDLI